MSRFRLVHFAPRPTFDFGRPVGALIDGERIQFVQGTLPHASCVGGAQMHAMLRMGLESLHSPRFDQLPGAAGPLFRLGEPRSIPVGVVDVVAWIQRMLDGSPVAEPRKQQTVQNPARASWGTAFFRTNNVADLVKTTFKARKDALWLDPEISATLLPISHWARGQNEVILMEPLPVTRHRIDDDIGDIAQRFALFSKVIHGGHWPSSAPKPRLVAYVLSGGSDDDRVGACARLRPFTDEVVDVEHQGERRAFIRTIQATGNALLS